MSEVSWNGNIAKSLQVRFTAVIMALDIVTSLPLPGFKFDNCMRNTLLASKGFLTPKAKKTGTTICACIYKDGVILGADTRATMGSIISDKNCVKIHYLAPNMYCCGAGTAADTKQVTSIISSQLALHKLATDRIVPVKVAERLMVQHLFRYHGHIGAALIVGGVDLGGPHVYSVSPNGHSDKLPFTAMGSGSLAAIAVLEKGWKADMELQEAMLLIRNGIAGGIFNDLGSGSNVDLCIITKDGVEFKRPYEIANLKGQRQGTYHYKAGTTAVLSSDTVPLEVTAVIIRNVEEEMDVEQ